MKDKLGLEWVQVAVTPDAEPKVVVDGLKENQTYQFRVKYVVSISMDCICF